MCTPGCKGVISAPFGQGGVAAVARDDLAEAAAIIARNPEKHQDKTYDLVGTTVITGQHQIPVYSQDLEHYALGGAGGSEGLAKKAPSRLPTSSVIQNETRC